MPARVTDFSLTTMRIAMDDYCKLSKDQLELLRVYSSRSWQDRGEFCFEVASYRVPEIQQAGMVLAAL